MSTFAKALSIAAKPRVNLVVLQRGFYQLSLAGPNTSLAPFLATQHVFRDIQNVDKSVAENSEKWQNSSSKGSFVDLAIWLALVSQVLFYVGFARPQQKKQQQTGKH
ncbi:hypothetical protein QR680_007617 [Steinernema hermaphroditum]|uniref:Uncharacterized protein n=1 Tax=Steinernema hermaphroditum TaxID=289476 RepID=A0AA39IDQ6_9BILA|nr:hypothetical protein QR680_007617 [Steinernema hermaphroditum]